MRWLDCPLFSLIPFPARSFGLVEEQGTVASAFGCVYVYSYGIRGRRGFSSGT